MPEDMLNRLHSDDMFRSGSQEANTKPHTPVNLTVTVIFADCGVPPSAYGAPLSPVGLTPRNGNSWIVGLILCYTLGRSESKLATDAAQIAFTDATDSSCWGSSLSTVSALV
jgi:hypothetical protein